MERPAQFAPAKSALLCAPPVPHEHGAWVMLYGPIVPILMAMPVQGAPTLLLIISITGFYLARHAASVWLRRRKRNSVVTDDNLVVWILIYGAIALAGTAPLFAIYARWQLLIVGFITALIWMFHSALQLWPARKRLDRSQWGEVLGASALSLTAPAAWICNGYMLNTRAWLLWLLCALFFGSGILFVKMLLLAAKEKNHWQPSRRWFLSRDLVIYHVLLSAILVCILGFSNLFTSLLLILAFAPAFIRSIWGTIKLSGVLPSLVKVGIREMLLSFWFLFWIGMAGR